MVRPLRLEYAGAIYHVFARGNRREPIYLDDQDFAGFVNLLGEVCARFNWVVHAYCLMTNHYHLLVETPDANLSRGMRQLNGEYTQRFNRRHQRVGHVFQGRYKAIIVQRGEYLLELTRYVVLNPVRARMVSDAGEWAWSSYNAQIAREPAPSWLDVEWLLGQFGTCRSEAVHRYVQFVAAGVARESPLTGVRGQLYLGDEAFGERLRSIAENRKLREISKAQRRPLAQSLGEYARNCRSRDEAMASAYRSGAYLMREIADYFGVHYMTVSRAVRRYESESMLDC